MCATNDGIEDAKYFCCFALPLQCHAEIFSLEFLLSYNHLGIQIFRILLMQVSLCGDKNFRNELDKIVLLQMLQLIHQSGLFD